MREEEGRQPVAKAGSSDHAERAIARLLGLN
jgi:hypothetical protein